MSDCECISGCPFFNDKMQEMPSLANRYKKKYCQGDFDVCARHRVMKALGKEKVPSDMYPNQAERADEMLNH